MGGLPREPPDDVPAKHHDRARELQMQLVVLEGLLESANFEDEAAYRRKIDEKREALDELRKHPE